MEKDITISDAIAPGVVTGNLFQVSLAEGCPTIEATHDGVAELASNYVTDEIDTEPAQTDADSPHFSHGRHSDIDPLTTAFD